MIGKLTKMIKLCILVCLIAISNYAYSIVYTFDLTGTQLTNDFTNAAAGQIINGTESLDLTLDPSNPFNPVTINTANSSIDVTVSEVTGVFSQIEYTGTGSGIEDEGDFKGALTVRVSAIINGVTNFFDTTIDVSPEIISVVDRQPANSTTELRSANPNTPGTIAAPEPATYATLGTCLLLSTLLLKRRMLKKVKV